LSEVPYVERLRIVGSEFAADDARLVSVLGEALLVAENGDIVGCSLGVNFAIQNRLLPEVCQVWPIVVPSCAPGV